MARAKTNLKKKLQSKIKTQFRTAELQAKMNIKSGQTAFNKLKNHALDLQQNLKANVKTAVDRAQLDSNLKTSNLKALDIKSQLRFELNQLESRWRNVQNASTQLLKNLWQGNGWLKLALTSVLGLATLIAAGLAEDRGAQLEVARASLNDSQAAVARLEQQAQLTQTELDEKNLRLLLLEQTASEQMSQEKALKSQVAAAAFKQAKTNQKSLSYGLPKKRGKRIMYAGRQSGKTSIRLAAAKSATNGAVSKNAAKSTKKQNIKKQVAKKQDSKKVAQSF